MTEYEEKYAILYNFAQHVSHVYELPESFSRLEQNFIAFVEQSTKTYDEDITMGEVAQRFISLYEQFFPKPVCILVGVLKELGSGLTSMQFITKLVDVHGKLLNLFRDFVDDFMKWQQEYQEAERLTPELVLYGRHRSKVSEEEIYDLVRRGLLNPRLLNGLKLFKRYLWGLELMTRFGVSDYYLALRILYDKSALQQTFTINSIEEIRHRAMRRDEHGKSAKALARLLARVTYDVKFGGRPSDTNQNERIVEGVETLREQGKTVWEAAEQVTTEIEGQNDNDWKAIERTRQRYQRNKPKK